MLSQDKQATNEKQDTASYSYETCLIKGPELLPNLPPVKQPKNKNTVIGTYQVTKLLGSGTFGKVMEAVHLFTMQKVAIKILFKDKISENDFDRVTREIHILKIVRHPHIIQLYEIIETSKRIYIIMEHCSNGELFSYLTSKKKLEEEEACRLFQQLVSAIQYLVELGIVHRDLKPENLLLDDQNNLKMVDFGLSNTYQIDEKLSTPCGSPCYAAPELIKGQEYGGEKVDIWSAGVVLFTLLCGHLPFEEDDTQLLYKKILSASYEFSCPLSRDVKELIRNILEPDPDLRYGLSQIISDEWFKQKHTTSTSKRQTLKRGMRVGIQKVDLAPQILQEMQNDQLNEIDITVVQKYIEANQHNALTSYYYLLKKKITAEQQQLDKSNLSSRVSLVSSKSQSTKTVIQVNQLEKVETPQREILPDIKLVKELERLDPEDQQIYEQLICQNIGPELLRQQSIEKEIQLNKQPFVSMQVRPGKRSPQPDNKVASSLQQPAILFQNQVSQLQQRVVQTHRRPGGIKTKLEKIKQNPIDFTKTNLNALNTISLYNQDRSIERQSLITTRTRNSDNQSKIRQFNQSYDSSHSQIRENCLDKIKQFTHNNCNQDLEFIKENSYLTRLSMQRPLQNVIAPLSPVLRKKIYQEPVKSSEEGTPQIHQRFITAERDDLRAKTSMNLNLVLKPVLKQLEKLQTIIQQVENKHKHQENSHRDRRETQLSNLSQLHVENQKWRKIFGNTVVSSITRQNSNKKLFSPVKSSVQSKEDELISTRLIKPFNNVLKLKK